MRTAVGARPDRVLEDVLEGWLSPGRARDAYSAVVDDDGKLDVEATRAALATDHLTGEREGDEPA